MPQTQSGTLSFPPFYGKVRALVLINILVFFAVLLFFRNKDVFGFFGLVPALVFKSGYLWQLVTYSCLHANIGHILFNMLALWMFGSTLEQYFGGRRFLEFYFFCVVGAALVTVLLTFTMGDFLRMSPETPTIGASGGIYGVLLGFGYLFPNREIFMF